ncbi:4-hydroxy-2-oxoglutarate aldolase @ 2-dehydro-3-deoxyphosphogluconate aldolase [hydrothermal vent metagenome]|uniref:2-dehydro-3-deoxy-phosphogluconate aldolase n=1 Tax=hydrothermal vent metagenome TaxID=652676 RepID=A0A3B0U3A4_9ZZZZ
MQNIEHIKTAAAKVRVIPVMVLDDISCAQPLAEALVAGGLNVLEVTLRTANALEIIKEMVKVKGAIVGSGTVLNLNQMRQSEDMGCQFMVSPGAPIKLLEQAQEVSIPLLPGVGSATEAMVAAEMGYSFLKLFPAEAIGGYDLIKSLASPFADLSFCPTGGINVKTAQKYLSLSNVTCVGGSWVTPSTLVENKDFKAIENLAKAANSLNS